jgi:hypothetical protein
MGVTNLPKKIVDEYLALPRQLVFRPCTHLLVLPKEVQYIHRRAMREIE